MCDVIIKVKRNKQKQNQFSVKKKCLIDKPNRNKVSLHKYDTHVFTINNIL